MKGEKTLKRDVDAEISRLRSEKASLINELNQAMHRLAEVQTLAQTGIWTNELNPPATVWSDVTYQIFGYTPGEATPEEIFSKHIHPEDEKNYWENIRAAVSDPEAGVPEMSFRIRDKHSELRYLVSKGKFERDENGKIIRAFGTIQDITDRINYEEVLQSHRNLLLSVIDDAPVAMAVYDSDNVVHQYNKKFTEIFGYTISDVPRVDSWFPLAYPDETYRTSVLELWTNSIEDYFRTGTFKPVDARVTCKDGSVKDIEFSFQAVNDTYLTTFVDLTHHKQVEYALQQSEQKYRNLFEKSKDPILLIDGNKFIDCNQAALEMLSMVSKDEIVGRTPSEISPVMQPDGLRSTEKAKLLINEAIRKGYIRFEWLHIAADGRAVYMEVSLTSIPGKGSIYLYTMWRDITRQKEQEFALKKAKEQAEAERNKFQTLVETLPVGVSLIDKKGNIVDANSISESILGVSQKQHKKSTLKSPIWKIVRKDGSTMPVGEYPASRVIAGEELVKNVIMGVQREDDTLTWISTSAAAIDAKAGGGAAVVYEDITHRFEAENALRASEERYHSLFENMSEAFILHKMIFNTKGKPVDFLVVDVNPAFARLTGRKPESVVGLKGSEIPEIDLKRVIKVYGDVALTGKPALLQQDSEDSGKYFELRCYKPAEGYVATTMSDISERVRAEKKLRDSEEKYRSLISALSEGVVMQSKNGEIIAVNKAAEKILGLTIDQLMGRSTIDKRWKAVHEDGSDFPEEHHPAMVALATGKPVLNETMGIHKPNGSLSWILVHAEPMLVPGTKEAYAVVTSFTDITQQRNSQKTIKESEERFKKLSNLTFEGIVIHDNGICIDANISFCSLFGLQLDDLIGEDIFLKIIHPDDQKKIRKMLKKQSSECIEITALKSDGSEFPLELETQQIVWGNENLQVSALRDITEQVKARNALLESEMRFKILSEVTYEGIIIHDQGIIRDVNLSMQVMIGQKREDMLGTNILDYVPGKYHKLITQRIEEKYVGAYEIRIMRKDGTQFPAEIIVKETEIRGKGLRVASVRDLSDKKFAAREIRKLSTAVMQSPVSILVTSLSGKIEYVNPAFTKISGYTLEEAYGKKTSILKSGHTPEKVYQKLWKTISAGKVWKGEFLNRKKNGALYWEQALIAPVLDDEGKIVNYLAIKEDITRRKESEQRLQETMADLERSNRDLEQFAYVSSHDLQEPLRKIKNYTELLAGRYSEMIDEQGKHYIDIITRGTSRMQHLIDDLLSYSRVSSKGIQYEKVDMNKLIGDVEDNLELSIYRAKAELVRDELPEITGDESQLYLLFQNLISNAIKFRREEALKINISAKEEQDTITFSVRDNGIGMKMKYAEKIFTVFQRLHSRDEYEGTGIGLAICKKIVERHAGKIWFESEEGKGTVFYIQLPRKVKE